MTSSGARQKDQGEVRHVARSEQEPRRPLQQTEATMTTPAPASEADLFEILSAVTITGPDARNLLWISLKTDDPLGMVSVRADVIAGHAVGRSAKSGSTRWALCVHHLAGGNLVRLDDDQSLDSFNLAIHEQHISNLDGFFACGE